MDVWLLFGWYFDTVKIKLINTKWRYAITVYHNLKLVFLGKMGRLEDTDKKDCSSMLVL